jgi:gamma-glutamyltranspeptidase/glutathione hydrolase
MGHVLNVRSAYSSTMGRGQAILVDTATGMHFAGSDPRADGSAEPEAAPHR